MSSKAVANLGQTKKLLFVCYGGGHVAMVIPVIRALAAYPHLEITVLGLTTAGQTLAKEGIPYIGFKDLIEPQDDLALAYGRELAEEMQTHSAVNYDETVAYLGLSFRDLVATLGEEKARIEYQQNKRAAFLPIITMMRFLTRLKPDVVIATNSPRAERASIEAAGLLGIPALCIVDLFVYYDVEWLGKAGYGQKICVLAPRASERLLAAGRHADEIVITGNPAFDRLAIEPSDQQKHEFFQRHGIQPQQKVIFWASQDEPDVYTFTGEVGDPLLPRLVDQELMGLLADHPDWFLVIRPHPSEQVSYPDPLPVHVSISVIPDELGLLLHCCDVVITFSSTVGLEGALIGKPLISLQQSVHAKYAPFAHLEIAENVFTWPELEPAIERALQQKSISIKGLPPVGAAAAKVAHEILVLASY